MTRRLRPSLATTRRQVRPLGLTRLEDRSVPALATWDGGGGTDNRWSTAANWVGDVAPHAGDDLVFPISVFPGSSTVNDLPAGTTFRNIRVTGPGYALTGNAITLGAGITVENFWGGGPSRPDVSLDITLAGPQTFATSRGGALNLTGAIDLNGQTLTAIPGPLYFPFSITPQDITIQGPVRGSGGLIVNSDGGSLVLSGPNSYTGPTDVRAGQVVVRSDSGLGATGVGNDTVVEPNGYLLLVNAAVPESITFAAHPGGKLSLEAYQATLSGALTLAGPNFFKGDELTISGLVGETGGSQQLTLFTGTAGTFPFGDGRMVFGPGSVVALTGGITIAHGQVRFDGSVAGPVTVPAGLLAGGGSVGAVTLGTGAGIAPAKTVDDPLSTLTINGDLTFGEISPIGLTIVHFLPDGRSDRVSVHGAVRITGDLHLLHGVNNAAIAPGTHFRIIDNDGTDPIIGTFESRPEGAIVGSAGGRYLRITYHGGDGNDVDVLADAVESPAKFAVGAGAGVLPIVSYFDGNGLLLRSFLAYDAGFRGGVRVATADFNGDGFPDIVTAPGPGGGPHVKIFDGITGFVLSEFMAYDPTFRGGVFLATGATTVAGVPDVITAAGAGGGPHVKVFNGPGSFSYNLFPIQGLSLQRSFFAYDPQFTGGVNVAAGDTDGDGLAEVVTGPGTGGGPDVRVFDVATARVVREFNAYDPRFTGGVDVAAADLNGDGKADIVTGAGAGGAPHVRAFSGTTAAVLGEFFAYSTAFFGGVVVLAADVDGDGRAEIITGPGAGGGPHIREFELTGALRREWFAFAPAFPGGVFIG